MMIRFFLSVFFSVFFIAFEAMAELDEAWLKLVLYQKKGNQYISLVENEAFFVSPEGRKNAYLEYEEEVKAFKKRDNPLRCVFPARFMYFKHKNLADGDLSDCLDYQKYLEDIQPQGVTMIFTNAYMSNPSSLFGHTLFRIDTARKGTQMLAHGANFGADTGDESGALYILKGLWGGYFGTFGLRPYWDVINLYNNIENRDIWEYELNLSDEELERFVALMWEMKNAKVRYYFASKNCSYMLLRILEATKPELHIVENFNYYTVPLDTLKALSQIDGLIKNTNYRPSRQSKLLNRKKQMNKAQYEALKDFIKTGQVNFNDLLEEEKADVAETLYQYVQYRYVEGALELGDYRKKSFKLLQERSKIKNQKQYFNELKNGENPIFSHKARTIALGIGAKNGNHFQEIMFEPIYTSLLDDSFGLLNGAEIGFMHTKFRHYDIKNKYELSSIDILHIKSLSGVDVMFSPFSYDINVRYQQKFNPKNGKDSRAIALEAGAGQSVKLNDNLMLYLMSVPQVVYGGGVRDNGYLGVSLRGGLYYNKKKTRILATLEQSFATNYWKQGQTYELQGAYGIRKNVSVYADYKFFNSKYKDDEEVGVGVRFHF